MAQLELTDEMTKDLKFYYECNPGKMAALVYRSTQFGWNFNGFSCKANAYMMRERMIEQSDWIMEDFMVVDLWNLEESK